MPHNVANMVNDDSDLLTIHYPQRPPELLGVQAEGLSGSCELDDLDSRQVEPLTKEVHIHKDIQAPATERCDVPCSLRCPSSPVYCLSPHPRLSELRSYVLTGGNIGGKDNTLLTPRYLHISSDDITNDLRLPDGALQARSSPVTILTHCDLTQIKSCGRWGKNSVGGQVSLRYQVGHYPALDHRP